MKKTTHILLLFLILHVGSLSAQRPAGLIWDDDAYDTIPQLVEYTGEKFKEIPIAVSLRPYCPTPGDQGNLGSCVAWATGYSCLSILEAIKEELTITQQITRRAYSASFIFNQINQKKDCYSGAKLHDAFEFLKQKGDCRTADFPNDSQACSNQPGEQLFEKAAGYRIKDYAALFHFRESAEKKIEDTRLSLAMKDPVVIGMGITQSFQELQKGQKVWNPSEKEGQIGGHALVVIGYDDVKQEFELINSYGTDWGDNGFVRMSYENFGRLVKYGYKMVQGWSLSSQLGPLRKTWDELFSFGHGMGSDQQVLHGKFTYRFPEFLDNGALLFKNEKVNFQQKNKYYLLEKEQNDLYQIVAKDLLNGQYLYVFSVDANNKIALHHPPQEKNASGESIRSSLVANFQEDSIIPGGENAFQLTVKGEEYVVILSATEPIDDILQRIRQFKSHSGHFADRFHATFGNIIIPDEYIAYNPEDMEFHCEAPGNKSHVVPVILKIKVY